MMARPLAYGLLAFAVAGAGVAVTSDARADSATPAPSSAPAVAATPAYHYVVRPTPAPETTPFPGPNAPQIAEIDITDATIVTPGDFHVRVLTSDAVTSVSAQTYGQSIAIPRAATGRFELWARIPVIPDYLKNRNLDIQFVATVPDGRTAGLTLPIVLR